MSHEIISHLRPPVKIFEFRRFSSFPLEIRQHIYFLALPPTREFEHRYPDGKGLSFLVTIEPRTYIIELREKGKEYTRAISALFDTCQESRAVAVRQYSEILRQVTGEYKKGLGRIYRPVRQRIFSKEEIRNAESLCQSLSWPAEQV
jgi:hypothetical protein